MRGVVLHEPEMRRLLMHGEVLLIRPLSPQPQSPCSHVELLRAGGRVDWVAGDNTGRAFRCPLGAAGEERFVKETWCQAANQERLRTVEGQCWYRADGEHVVKCDGDGFTEFRKDGSEASPWRSAQHMPEWASRAHIEVASVNAKRLGDLTHEEAGEAGGYSRTCGCKPDDDTPCWRGVRCEAGRLDMDWFREQWAQRYGKRYPAASSPWVWCVLVRRKDGMV